MANRKRYYITWYYGYHILAIKDTLRQTMASNIRTAYQYGWNNQPRIVTFSAIEAEIQEITERVYFNHSTGVREKDWR